MDKRILYSNNKNQSNRGEGNDAVMLIAVVFIVGIVLVGLIIVPIYRRCKQDHERRRLREERMAKIREDVRKDDLREDEEIKAAKLSRSKTQNVSSSSRLRTSLT